MRELETRADITRREDTATACLQPIGHLDASLGIKLYPCGFETQVFDIRNSPGRDEDRIDFKGAFFSVLLHRQCLGIHARYLA